MASSHGHPPGPLHNLRIIYISLRAIISGPGRAHRVSDKFRLWPVDSLFPSTGLSLFLSLSLSLSFPLRVFGPALKIRRFDSFENIRGDTIVFKDSFHFFYFEFK